MKTLTFLTALLMSTHLAHAAGPRFELTPWPWADRAGLLATPAPDAEPGAPLFTLTGTNSDVRAEGWLTGGPAGLHLRVRVQDADHRQNAGAARLYEGDSLQFAVDALGDGPYDAPTSATNDPSHAVRRDDADYCLGLTEKGEARAWSYYHGQPRKTGARTDLQPAITRDDTNRTTTYEIQLPWSEFGLAPGVSDRIGFAVQLNSAQPDRPVERLTWGGGIGGQFRPRLFKRIGLAPVTGPLHALATLKPTLLSAEDAVELAVVVPGQTAAELQVTLGAHRESIPLPAGDKSGLRRFRLRAFPGGWVNGSLPLTATLKPADPAQTPASLTLTLRDDAQTRWYAFQPAEDRGPSVIGMESWLDRPAGKRGRLTMDGGRFRFADGTPVKFWGVNDQYASVAPPTNEAPQRAAQYAKYGINAVRMHKWSEPGWAGIGHTNDATRTDEAGLARFDFMFAQFKEHGIYAGWSPFFGHKVRPGNRDQLLAYDEVVQKVRGSTYGLVNFAPDLQDLLIQFAVNMLNHRNPHTGLRYADDPALIYLEMHNEDSIQWYAMQGVLNNCPTYRQYLQQRYADWLLRRYGSEEGLLKAWGPTALNAFPEFATNESLSAASIAVLANPWFSIPASLDQMEREKGARHRLLDNFRFLYETQNEFFDRYEKAVRATGYRGLLIGSCWQSDGIGRYYNLHSDYRIGFIDRHNYYSGVGTHFLRAAPIAQPDSLLVRPVGELLATGFQAVQDRPFSVSEWDSVVPNEWRAEAPALMAFYGLGLQGWDASFQFCSDRGTFSPTVEKPGQIFNVQHPTQLGLYPLYARALARGDLKEGTPIAIRNIQLDGLAEGRLDFVETLQQDGDHKVFGGDVPAEALAVGKVMLQFTAEEIPSTRPDLTADLAARVLKATTGQLTWNYAEPGREHVVVNSPGTRGLIGFMPNTNFALGNIQVQVDNRFAVVLLTSLDRNQPDAEKADHLLLCAVARAYNTGMRYHETGQTLEDMGGKPILMEPVWAQVTVPGATQVNLLDHDGRRTGKTIPVRNGRFRVNGVTDRTLYYEIIR